MGPAERAITASIEHLNYICYLHLPDLCQVRLDFDNLVTAGPPTTTATKGNCATGTDFLTTTSPTGSSPPVICGTLTGQHSKDTKCPSLKLDTFESCLFIDGPVSRPTTHSQNCWFQSTSAEFASWVLAQLGSAVQV